MKTQRNCLIFILFTLLTIAKSMESESVAKSGRRDCPWACECNYDERIVDCSHQELNNIPRDIPRWTKKLLLTGNFINNVKYGSLQHLRELEELDLNHNFISKFNAGMIRRLANLRRLNLSRNRLSHMTTSPFRRLKNLKKLSLHYNKLHKFNVDTFKGLDKLEQLDISNNMLQTLETSMFDHMTKLTHLYVVGNKWHCDCKLKAFEMYMRKNNLKYGYMICDSPGDLSRQNLKDVNGSMLCGPRTNVLIAAVFGILLGFMAIIFAIVMCRKHAALNAIFEINSSGIPKPMTVTEDSSARSSVISMLSDDRSEKCRSNHLQAVDNKRHDVGYKTEFVSVTLKQDDIEICSIAPPSETFN